MTRSGGLSSISGDKPAESGCLPAAFASESTKFIALMLSSLGVSLCMYLCSEGSISKILARKVHLFHGGELTQHLVEWCHL